jgi:hypothetical protein
LVGLRGAAQRAVVRLAVFAKAAGHVHAGQARGARFAHGGRRDGVAGIGGGQIGVVGQQALLHRIQLGSPNWRHQSEPTRGAAGLALTHSRPPSLK